MTGSAFFHRRATRLALPCLIAGAICCGLGALSFVLSRNLFDPVTFGRRAADSLSDPGVAAYAADVVTSRIIHRKPDLIAFRPMLLSATQTVVSNKPFRAVVEQAAARAHEAVFSRSSQQVLLSLPDLDVLVHDALKNASPVLAAKFPKSLDATVAKLANSRATAVLIQFAHAGKELLWIWPLLFGASLVLHVAGLCLATDRQRALARAGFGLVAVGLLLAGIVVVNGAAGLWVHQAKELGLVRGLWRAYLGDLTRWGLSLAGLGILIASGASAFLERIDPMQQLARVARNFTSPPSTHGRRFLWGLTLLLGGCMIVFSPGLMLNCAAVVTGVGVAYLGSRELFRLAGDSLERVENRVSEVRPEVRRRRVAAAVTGLLVVGLGGAWLVWRNPTAAAENAVPAVLACNGYPELCDRRLDQVVFAGAHNAMSSQDVPGWMFPHHEAGMPQMLRDGIRALLIDVHYGFAGGERIKTNMSTEPTTEKIKQAIGVDGFAAAMRIRDRLSGVDESQRGLYFCHGFCELGAYPVAPALREIRGFMVAHPDEVIVLVVEDTVTPQDLAAEFDRADLTSLVYQRDTALPWPTLRGLIESGRRVVVFLESGRPGVAWLRPAFENIRETPYTFHKVEDLSCRANRGGDTGSLFQINHWIDTTPAPKPSNAAVVNAYPFLLARARKCAAERRHLPNLIAVDFYQTGDVLAVVNQLNGVTKED